MATRPRPGAKISPFRPLGAPGGHKGRPYGIFMAAKNHGSSLQGLGGHVRARAIANKPISITPPPEMRLLRIQLGPEQGTT